MDVALMSFAVEIPQADRDRVTAVISGMAPAPRSVS